MKVIGFICLFLGIIILFGDIGTGLALITISALIILLASHHKNLSKNKAPKAFTEGAYEVEEKKSQYTERAQVDEKKLLELIEMYGTTVEMPDCLVVIKYVDKKGQLTERTIKVTQLMMVEDGELYLRAYCYLRDEMRTFRIRNIQEATFEKTPIDLSEYLLNEFSCSPIGIVLELIRENLARIVLLNFIAQFESSFTRKKKELIADHLIANDSDIDREALINKLGTLRPDFTDYRTAQKELTKEGLLTQDLLDIATTIAGKNEGKLKLVQMLEAV